MSKKNRRTILHTLSSVSREGAGVFGFCSSLLKELPPLITDNLQLIGVEDEFASQDIKKWAPLRPTVLSRWGAKKFYFSFFYTREIKKCRPDLIHSHGMWQYPTLAVNGYVKKFNIPYIVSPHGMLDPWSFKHNFWKKRPIWHAWEKYFISNADILHATSAQEASNFRAMGFGNPIAVIPAGVEIPDIVDSDSVDAADKTKVILFLSRIHPQKGVIEFIQSCQGIDLTGWKIIIAGPDANNHKKDVELWVEKLGMKEYVQFYGSVDGVEKSKLFKSADLFILPSFTESFGIVIAEALAYGVPVITTKGAPWDDLLKHDCGWWVDMNINSLRNTIDYAMRMNPIDRCSMGKRGRQLIKEKYSKTHMTQQFVHVYEWVLNKGKQPDCILID